MNRECGSAILTGNAIRDVAELHRCAAQRFHSAMVKRVVFVGLLSLIPLPLSFAADTPSPAVLEKARQWYLHEIAKADEACETAKTKLAQARNTLQRVEALLDRASAGDVAGRSVALQAAAAAKSAIQKNEKREARECGRAAQLRARAAPTGAPDRLAAVITVSRGTVTVQTPSGPIPWTQGALLQPGQTISTGPDGEFDLELPGDAGRIRVGKNSSFTLAERGQLLFEAGRFHYVHRKTDDTLGSLPARFEKMLVRFPMRAGTSSIGVRGTEFETAMETDGTATVVVFDGEVTVQGEEMKEAVVVHAGQQVRFTGKTVFDGPLVADLKQRARWWE